MSNSYFILVSDDDGHDYVIPHEKLTHWYEVWWGSEDFRNGEEPDYAERVEGTLMFKEYKLD